MKAKMTVTLYSNLYETTPLETRTIGWPEFLNIFCELGWRKAYRKTQTKKKDLPLWSPVKLIEGRTRHTTSIEYVSALVLDYDGNADASDIESVWGDWCLANHTTWNHTADVPRFRVILPMLRDVDRREYDRIIRWAMSRSDKLGLKTDPSCKDASRAWYFPAKNPDNPNDYRYIAYYEDEAPLLDPDELLTSTYEDTKTRDEGKKTMIFVDVHGEEYEVQEWAKTVEPGAKVKGYCPYTEDSSPGAAFMRRTKDGVLIVCMSERHGHKHHPMKWFFHVDSGRSPFREGDDVFYGYPEPDVVGMLDQKTTRDGTPTGVPKNTKRNVYLILKHDTRWKGRIWQDLFRGTLMLDEREYKDTDDTRIALWLDVVYGMVANATTVTETVILVGEENGIHPLHDYLKATEWDGSERINDWLVRGLGVEDNELNREMGRKWMVQAVARALTPGCKADTCLILVGPQGARKSSALRALAGEEFFTDTPLDIGSVNAYTQIRRTWIYEVAELDSIRRSHHSATKAFITAQEDTYRPPYGRHSITVKRHVVFCGTTNSQTFLNDPTGSRRFWPVSVGLIDLTWIRESRDQLWAEAVHALNAGEQWWLEEDMSAALREASAEYTSEDPWFQMVEVWLKTQHQPVTTKEIMESALSLDSNQMTRLAEMRVGEIMGRLQYTRQRRSVSGTRAYFWIRPQNKVMTVDFTPKNESDDDPSRERAQSTSKEELNEW